MSSRDQIIPDVSWMDEAACRSHDPRKWFPVDSKKGGNGGGVRIPKQAYEALVICEGCPVNEECLEYSLQWEPYGIWGGKTEQQRNRIRLEREIEMLRVRPVI